jgi:hypothetical protein
MEAALFGRLRYSGSGSLHLTHSDCRGSQLLFHIENPLVPLHNVIQNDDC